MFYKKSCEIDKKVFLAQFFKFRYDKGTLIGLYFVQFKSMIMTVFLASELCSRSGIEASRILESFNIMLNNNKL